MSQESSGRVDFPPWHEELERLESDMSTDTAVLLKAWASAYSSSTQALQESDVETSWGDYFRAAFRTEDGLLLEDCLVVDAVCSMLQDEILAKEVKDALMNCILGCPEVEPRVLAVSGWEVTQAIIATWKQYTGEDDTNLALERADDETKASKLSAALEINQKSASFLSTVDYSNEWESCASSLSSSTDENLLESGWLFDPLADAMQSQITPEVKDLLQYWADLYKDTVGIIDPETAIKSLFTSAVQSCPGGGIFDIPIVVEAVKEMLTTDDLDQEQKVALVKAILSCEDLSFTHLFCSPGGSETIKAIFDCAREHNDCEILQICALQTLPQWAGQVHQKAQIMIDPPPELMDQMKKKTKGCGINLKGKGTILRLDKEQAACSNFQSKGICNFNLKCRYSHPFNKESILAAWRRRSGNELRALNSCLRKLELPTALEARASDEWASAVKHVSRLIRDDDYCLKKAERFCRSLKTYYGKQPEFADLEGKFRPAGQNIASKVSDVEIPEALLVKSRIHNVMFPVITEETKGRAIESLVHLCVNTEAWLLAVDSAEALSLRYPLRRELYLELFHDLLTSGAIPSISLPDFRKRFAEFNQMKPDECVLEYETTLDDPDNADSRGPASVQGCDSDEAPDVAAVPLCSTSVPESITNTSNGDPVHSLWSIITGSNNSDDNKYEWQALISQRAVQKFRRDRDDMDDVKKRLEELMCGEWTDNNAKMLTTQESKGCRVPLYEIRPPKDLRVIWQVEYTFLPQLKCWSQCILVWDIVKHSGITHEVNRINQHHRSYSKEHRKMCRPNNWPSRLPGTRVLPISQEMELEDSEQEDSKISSLPLPRDATNSAEAEAHEKLYCLSKEMLDFLRHGKESKDNDRFMSGVEFPLHLSPEEYNVAMHHKSALVVGRSGTGKTVCNSSRLLARHTASSEYSVNSNSDGRSSPPVRRMLFVTAAPALCVRVKQQFDRLKRGVEGLRRQPSPPFNAQDPHFPGSSGDSAPNMGQQDTEQTSSMSANETISGGASHAQDSQLEDDERDDALMEEAEIMEQELPDNLAEVEDSKWPIFVTFEKLTSMVEGMLAGRGILRKPPCPRKLSPKSEEDTKDDLDFEEFSAMWSSFDQGLTSRLNPSLVWTEICSVIKGSNHVQNADGSGRPLTRDEYLCEVGRWAGFPKESREIVYSLFENYEKKKRTQSRRDHMDRVQLCVNGLQTLLSREEEGGLISLLLHEVHCDEVQDLVQLQVKMLLQLCVNAQGLYFSGDTAQTIANGAAFRFEHTRATCYQYAAQQAAVRAARGFERSNASKTAAYHPWQASIAQAIVSWARATPEECTPDLLHLKENYRSHKGILQAAGVVLDLIMFFFKDSVDSLEKDTSSKEGYKPEFVKEASLDGLDKHLFSMGIETGECELGADQVILVRNEATQKEVEDRFGPTALVLTIYEAKGREFNDVLIYNFFKDSPANSAQIWRTILNYHSVHGHGETSDSFASSEGIPTFDREKHNPLCSELKNLYTAITRARKTLVFFDEDRILREPMMRCWQKDEIIEIISQENPSKQGKHLAKKSTPEQWADQGGKWFQSGHYLKAAQCFRNSLDKKPGDPRVERRLQAADACVLMGSAETLEKQGRQRQRIPKRDIKEKYLEAARTFRDLPNRSRWETKKAANGFEKAGELAEAAEMYFATGQNQELHKAAELFHRAGKPAREADTFEALGQYRSAVSVLLAKKMVDDAIRRLGSDMYKAATMEPGQHAMLVQRAARVGVRQAQKLIGGTEAAGRQAGEHTMSLVMVIIDSYEERVALLKESGCTEQLLALYIRQMAHCDAASLLMELGRYTEAACQFGLAAGAASYETEKAELACLEAHCRLTAAYACAAPKIARTPTEDIPQPLPAMVLIAKGFPALDLTDKGASRDALELTQRAAVALSGIPEHLEHVPIGSVGHPAMLRCEAAALEALCGPGDVMAAFECVRSFQIDPASWEAWGRVTLMVLSLVLSENTPMVSKLLGGVAAWDTAIAELQKVIALAKNVLWCCSAKLGVQDLRRRRETFKEEIRLLKGLCGLREEKIDSMQADEVWDKLPQWIARGVSALLQAWDAFSDNHRAHQVGLRPLCTGHRLYGQCFIHRGQPHLESEEYQLQWRASIARQAAMVDLNGHGGMQWLVESPHMRHLGPDVNSFTVLGRVRRWTERLASCLLPKGSDMCMAPWVLQEALAYLPYFTKISLGELADRVWLRAECKTPKCVPGKVLHSALLLLQLGQVNKLALWKVANNRKGHRAPQALLHWQLFDSLTAFDGTGNWKKCLDHGLVFVEAVLQATESAIAEDEPPYVYTTSGGKDKSAEIGLDPLDMAILLEILVTVASSACKSANQVLLPEGFFRTWLAPRPRLVQSLCSVQAREEEELAAHYARRCVVAATRMMCCLHSASWLHSDSRRQSCAPATGGDLRLLWGQGEAMLRLAVASVVGTVNSPRRLQRDLMTNLRIAHKKAGLANLSYEARGPFEDGRMMVGWKHQGVIKLLKAMAGQETGLKPALAAFCSAELPGPLLLSKNRHSRPDASQNQQIIMVDPNTGLLVTDPTQQEAFENEVPSTVSADSMLEGPQPNSVRDDANDTVSEDCTLKNEAAQKIQEWKTKVFEARKDRKDKPQRLTREIEATVAPWKQSGKRLARACGLVFRRFVGPYCLVKPLFQEKRRLIKERNKLDLADEDEYEAWVNIEERQLPKVQDALDRLQYNQARRHLDLGVSYDLCSLAKSCRIAGSLMRSDCKHRQEQEELEWLQEELEWLVQWAEQKTACSLIESRVWRRILAIRQMRTANSTA